MEKASKLKILTNGIIRENPVLVLLLGTCPTLATSTLASNGVGMGLAVMFVLTCSNMAISALKNIIPNKVRIPCYIVVIASFVTITELVVKAYAPAVDKALGIFLPLIVVNCIILGRAEMFANSHSIIDSALDGLGMGFGYMLALIFIGSVREIIGSGTWFGLKVIPGAIDPMTILLMAPGGFFIFGFTIALVNYFTKGKAIKRQSMGCEGCPSAAACSGRNITEGECK